MRMLSLFLLLVAGCIRISPEDFEAAKDQDRDGAVDENYGGPDCNPDDASIHPGAQEVCDGVDNDCDGTIDEADAADAVAYYLDQDGDGYGADDHALLACELPAGHVAVGGDCDDSREDVNPGAAEQCDETDHDCDGESGWVDGDGDGVAVCEGDCDDDDAKVHPEAIEICDEIDNDCDDTVDEDDAADAATWYRDGDGDGFGDLASTTLACDQPSGFTALEVATDCDDSDGEVHPDADEICDGVDNNCDDEVDEDDAVDAATWYADADSDGFGDLASTTLACEQPSGFTAIDAATDCDDGDASQHPGADEYCNGEDDDCDGATDEDDALDAPTWYADDDGDGYGDPDDAQAACDQPSGFEADGDDCDDGDAEISPSADERCDGLDNDCDGSVDYEHNVPTDYGTVQDAADAASAGESICVLAGTYTESVTIQDGITLEGQDRDTTIIDALGASTALTLDGATNAVVRGFTLTGATGSSGGGVHADRSDATLEDILIAGNVLGSGGYCSGPILFVGQGTLTISDLEIRDNSMDCDDMWGAVFTYNYGDLILERVSYTGNDIYASGNVRGGFQSYSTCSIEWDNGIIAGNTLTHSDGAVDVYGGVLNAEGGSLSATNLTIHGNDVDAGTGTVHAGVLYNAGYTMELLNTTLSSNTVSGGSIYATVASGLTSFDYGNVYDYASPSFANMTDPTSLGTVYLVDPLFADLSAADPWDWDLSLQSGSPLIDAGDPSISDADGSVADIGAYGGPGGQGW